jgi:aflatoxin B1 aldehyde reductase
MSLKPRLILGLFTFSPNEYHGGRIGNLDDFKTALNIFQSRGYNELDTARSYGGGSQENFTREAGWKEKGFQVSTKIYPFAPISHRREDIIEQFNLSLSSLGADSIDVNTTATNSGNAIANKNLNRFSIYMRLFVLSYLARGLSVSNINPNKIQDRNTPFSETLQALDELHKTGKFRQLGLSNFSAFEVAEVVTMCKYNNWIRPTVYQGLYNCMTRSVEAELIPACRRYGLDFVVYAPTAGGFLSGKYANKRELPKDGRFSDGYVRGQWARDRYFQDSNFAAVEMIRAASEKHGLTMIDVALRWLVHHSKLNILSGNDGVIIGISRLDQLSSNINALENKPLPDDVVQALDSAWLLAKPQAADYWHGELTYTYNL